LVRSTAAGDRLYPRSSIPPRGARNENPDKSIAGADAKSQGLEQKKADPYYNTGFAEKIPPVLNASQ
jgi:hypothetical protein